MTRRLVPVGLRAVALIFPALALACSGREEEPAPPAPAARAEAPVETKEYPLAGEVRGVDAEEAELRIRHEEIPGFMPAMTMPFQMPEGTDFSEFHLGDYVEGTLRVRSRGGVTEGYDLVGLEVVKPAIKPLVLEMTPEGPKLVEPSNRLRPGDQVPDFTMIQQDVTSRKLSELRGNVVVLTFIYTRCPLPEFCPMMDRKFNELSQSVAANPARAGKVRLVSLSFDPDHDTPEVLSKHAAIRGAKPPLWTYATASHDDLAAIAPALGLTFGPRKNEIVHNLCTAVIGPDGRLARLDVGTKANAWTASDMLRTISEALASGGD
ncbi:SCO family protein [Paludisphaera sp.]|uniref:SCO family protein n=1 Tax=Paludisphaera sp. TaxID=2017432 RepID=UPI00301C0241